MYTIVCRQVYCTFMKVYGGTCTTVVLIYKQSTVVQLCITSIIYKSAVTIKFSGNLDSGSETVTSTSFETPYGSLGSKINYWRKYRWRAGGFFGARAARARARGTRAHVRNVPSSVLPKSTVRNLESSCTGCRSNLSKQLF